MPNHPTTPLASGQINHDHLTIKLVDPGNDLPNAVVVKWPQKPTITSPPASTRWLPTTFDQVVADAMKILSNGRHRIGRPSRVEKTVNAAEALAEARRRRILRRFGGP